MSYSYARNSGSLGYGLFGLGDAAYDQAYANYQRAHDAWAAASRGYTSAYASWAAGEAEKSRSYAAAVTAYNTKHAADLLDAQRMPILKRILASQGITVPDSYNCVTQAELDSWNKQCSAITSVKGLGALSGNPCVLSQVLGVGAPRCGAAAVPPVRQPPAPAPTPPGPEPQPPTPPPAVIPTPTPVPTPTPTPTYLPPPPVMVVDSGGGAPIVPGPTVTPDPTVIPPKKSGGLLSSGLILLVVAGGGYALYRTFKKPRAA